MGIYGSYYFTLIFMIFVSHLINHVCLGFNDSCDWFQGSWVYNSSTPRYNSSSCPFIKKFANCQGNGRTDSQYQKYVWQPTGCNLTRFDGLEFLKKFQGKHIMFVGDSLSQNQYESLICMLYTSLPILRYNTSITAAITTLTLLDYDLKVSLDINHYFVDIKSTPTGWMLDLDSIKDGKNWLGIDTLIFNTWQWWSRKSWDYVKDGDKYYPDLKNRTYGIERALGTWASWVDANIDTNKTKVFFTGVSPSHYHGEDWGEQQGNCLHENTPISGSKYPGPKWTMPADMIKSTLRKMQVPVTFLDITTLSLLRKDGHPSIYGQKGAQGMDCTHWCLSGVPDTWNQFLYNFLIF